MKHVKYSKANKSKQVKTWATRIVHNGEEAHVALFKPFKWPGTQLLSLDIPGRHIYVSVIDEPNRKVVTTHYNGDLNRWDEIACQVAKEMFVAIYCRTAEEIEATVQRVAKRLPKHSRVALERLEGLSIRLRSGLS